MIDPKDMNYQKIGEDGVYVNIGDNYPRPKLRAKTETFLAACRASHQLKKGRYYQINIMHDDWCPCLTKGLDCECNPDFEIYCPTFG